MKQQQFEQLHHATWNYFQQLLDDSGDKKTNIKYQKKASSPELLSKWAVSETDKTKTSINNNASNFSSDGYDFINVYRVVCQHYSLAKQRHYSPQLVGYLHDLVITGHHQLYQRQGNIWSRMYQFYAYTFPVRFREHIGLFWLSFACFTAPLLLMGLTCYFDSDMLYTVMSPAQVHSMEDMYDPSNLMIGRDSERHADTDMRMFGHYIMNNVGIDFRIYGMGLFAGIGTLLSVFYNGLVIGGVAGHLTGVGYGETFWSFVAGHGSFELTAAVISGAAGLRLAQSLFMPANYSRGDAFKIAGKQSIEILIGAASMTFIAAFIEAFWSSSSIIPNMVKYVVAVILWLMVIGYLMYAGRSTAYSMQSEVNDAN